MGDNHGVADEGSPRAPARPANGDSIGTDEQVRVVDTAVNPFCLIDLAGTILWAGDSIRELLGWTPEELVGSSMLDLVAPDSMEVALESMAAAMDYIATRDGAARTWEGVGPNIELRRADGSTVHCAVAVATPVRTQLPGIVLQLRRADSASALERALVAMGRGDAIEDVLTHIVAMIEGELPEVEVAVAHRCTPDDQLQVVGSPPGLGRIFRPGAVTGTPWQATAEDPSAIVEDSVDALPEPLRTRARDEGFRWLSTVGVRAPGPGQHRAFVAVWSRHPYEAHVFNHDRLRRAADLVGLVIQWAEGRRALEWAVTHDGLTGLANRSAFVGALESRSPADELTAVLYLDLDDFKPVNDTHGHALGDRVLAEVAARLRHGVRPTDVVARLGGDEFAVLCPAIGDLDAAQALADRLVEAVAQPIEIGGVSVRIGLSVGIAALVDGDDADLVLERADAALRGAKGAGKRRWAIR
ncbi:MAG: diguanylate cyclase domain-containing protein [Acidimicrobiia bacterium]